MRRIVALALLLPLAACDAPQSMLGGPGDAAQMIETLWWAMLFGSILIFALVMGLLVYGWGSSRPPPGTRLVVWGGVVLPVVTLSGLLAYSVVVGERLLRLGDSDGFGFGVCVAPRDGEAAPVALANWPPPLRIEVEGLQWWWRVWYPELPDAVTANEIRVPVGVPVEIRVRSADVIHSLWFPGIAGKVDMTPGRIARLPIVVRETGVWRGVCAEFCGAQHALMALYLVALEQDEFDEWLARQAAPVAAPADPFLAHGRQVFMDAGCGACHTVRGTPAAGVFGPDLSRVGSRVSIGAGTLPGNLAGIQGWIADSQTHKPGNKMPNFDRLSGVDLRAVAAWLAELK